MGTSLQVETAAAGVVEVACVHASGLERQHAESCWPHYTGHEHSPALYEGPWQPYTRSVYAHMMYCIHVFETSLTFHNLFRNRTFLKG